MSKQNRITNSPRWQQYHQWLYVLVLPVYLALFFITEHFIGADASYTVIYHTLDDLVPFCEWFYIPYVLWYPFMGLVGLYLAFKDGEGFKRYMTYIGASFITAIGLFVLFPNGQDLRPDLAALGRDNLFTRAIAALYVADTNTNVCPSLHVVGSMAAVFGIFHHPRLRKTVWLPIGGIILAVLICLSTVFLKQHSVVDVFVGIPYGFLMYGAVYWLPALFKKRERKSFKTSIATEKP